MEDKTSIMETDNLSVVDTTQINEQTLSSYRQFLTQELKILEQARKNNNQSSEEYKKLRDSIAAQRDGFELLQNIMDYGLEGLVHRATVNNQDVGFSIVAIKNNEVIGEYIGVSHDQQKKVLEQN